MSLFDEILKPALEKAGMLTPKAPPAPLAPAPAKPAWENSDVAHLLGVALDCAVPMWILEIKAWRWSWEMIERRARICAQEVASKGDIIQYKSKGTAEAFNRLAEGLACLAFAPGGVTFLGRHWQEEMKTWE
jgi:hypothetical protein